MFRVESHTRVADSVGYTLDSDSLILSQLNQQICVFCFTDYCVLIFVQMKKKKALDAECLFSDSIEEKSSSECSETTQN